MSADSRIRRSLSTSTEVDRLLRRISCQIAFARAIDDGHFTSLLDSAEQRYQQQADSVADLRRLVAEAEEILAPVATEAKKFTVHLVGHGHIDMNWMWSWPETCATTHDTFASVLSLMDQYPELTYSQSQASVYALIEQYHPQMFEQIKQRVQEGRWEVAAVHWVEGDKNLASGESLAHHLLYTRQYFAEKFGLTPEDCQLDWEPDTFGHCNTLPGILRQGGVKYYYCCRPGGGQEHVRVGDERPPIFWWQSPDGSRVLVNKETTWYNSYVEIGDNFALPAAAFWRKTGLRDWLNVYGIGNHGGGPTRAEIEYFLETRDWPCWPAIQFSTAQGYMRKIEPLCADMPVIDHELNFEFTGCYTSQSAIKKANRYGENFCVEAEVLSAAALHEADHERRSNVIQQVRQAWIGVLFNQFHDILPGSGVAATRHHALGLFQETGAITGAIKRNALQAIATDLDTLSLLPDTADGRAERNNVINTPFEAGSGQGAGESGISRASGGGNRFRPILIFNPCAWPRSELVKVSLYDLARDIPDDQIIALDEHGNRHPTLNVTGAAGGTHDWGHRRTDLLFNAKDIPALGYKVFLFCEGEANAETAVEMLGEREFAAGSLKLKLAKYQAGIEEAQFAGSRDSLVDVVGCGIGGWSYGTEGAKGMSAWLLSDQRMPWDEIPSYGPSFRVIGGRSNEATGLRSGGAFAALVTQQLRIPDSKSTINLTTTLSSDATRVDWHADIDWREIGDAERGIPGLKLEFSFSEANVRENVSVLFETPFGTVSRSFGGPGYVYDREDVPSLRFAHVRIGSPEGSTKTMTLLQDSKYGHFFGNGLGLRVLRSTYDPDHAPEVAKSSMRYGVVFHETEPTQAELVRLGAAFNHPLMVVPVLLQEGSSPTTSSFAEVESESIVLSTMKLGEAGGLILRLVNYADEEATAIVRLHADILRDKTRATTVDLMERPFEGDAVLDGERLRVHIGANSFATVKLD